MRIPRSLAQLKRPLIVALLVQCAVSAFPAGNDWTLKDKPENPFAGDSLTLGGAAIVALRNRGGITVDDLRAYGDVDLRASGGIHRRRGGEGPAGAVGESVDERPSDAHRYGVHRRDRCLRLARQVPFRRTLQGGIRRADRGRRRWHPLSGDRLAKWNGFDCPLTEGNAI